MGLALFLSGVPASAHPGRHDRAPAPTPVVAVAFGLTPDAALATALESALAALPPHVSQVKASPAIALRGARMHADANGAEIVIDVSSELLAYRAGSESFENIVHALHTAAFDAVAAYLDPTSTRLEFRIEIEGVPLPRFFDFERALVAAADGVDGANRSPAFRKNLSGRRVAVSPGHGWTFYNGGWNRQRAFFFGIVEDDANSDFVLPLNNLLKTGGAFVRPTRELDRNAGLGESGKPKWQESARVYVKSLGLPASLWDSLSTGDDYDDDIRVRPLYANWADAEGNRAEVLVSLHNNGGGGTGTETWYDTANGFQAESKRLADAVHNKVINAIRAQYRATWTNRLVKGSAGGYGENRLATRPAIIVEIAFMDTKSPDNDAIQDPAFRGIVAQAVADGIADFFATQPDSGPPSVPGNLAAETKSASQIDLRWVASTDDVGVAAYRILRNDVEIAQTSRNYYTDTGLDPATTYRYRVAARDFAGNWSVPSSALDAATTAPTPFHGLWWNPAESGWGMTVTQHREAIFAAIFSYDAQGRPAWVVMPDCPLTGTVCTGALYRVTGGVAPTAAWSGAALQVVNVGSGMLSFADGNNGSFAFTIDGAAGSKAIVRQPLSSGTASSIDFTDLWWNAGESGWGLSLAQEADVIFAAWFTYDANGAATWYVASQCALTGVAIATSCTGALYAVSGGSPLTVPWGSPSLSVVPVGTLRIDFTDASNATLSYTIHGVAGTRKVTRQPF